MSDDRVRELLTELGLSEFELGAAEAVELPAALVGQAKGIPTLSDLRSRVMVPVAAAVLTAAGFQAQIAADGSRVVRFLSSSPDQPLVAHTLSASGFSGVIASGEKDVVWIDLNAAGMFLLEGGGRRVIAEVEEERLLLRELAPGVALARLSAIPAPQGGWLGMTSDTWLNDRVAELMAIGDSWSVGIAAGMQARLTNPAKPVAPGEVLDASITRPRQWARALTAAEASTLERLALAEVDRLNGVLDDLTVAGELDDDWCLDWVRACESRDDLEGLRLLLAEAGRAAVLTDQLAVVDRAGVELRMRAPLARVSPGERLHRARLLDVDSWWGWSD